MRRRNSWVSRVWRQRGASTVRPKVKLTYRKKVLFSLVTLLIVIAVSEVALRCVLVYFVGPRVLLYGTPVYRDARTIPSAIMVKVGYTPPTPTDPISPYHKFAPHEIKYDHDEHGVRFSPTINSSGFRGSTFTSKKKTGVLRVITLGASSTFGYHNRDDETYPYLLQQMLNEGGTRDLRFEVYNLGIPHINSGQLLSLFVAEALPLNPDVITIYAGLNDSRNNINHVMMRRKNFGGLYEFIRERMVTLAFLDSYLYYSGIRHYTKEDFDNLVIDAQTRFVSNVSRIFEECQKRNILCLVATQQARSRLIEREEVKGISYETEIEMVREKLHREGLARRELAFLIHGEVMNKLRAWARETEVDGLSVTLSFDT